MLLKRALRCRWYALFLFLFLLSLSSTDSVVMARVPEVNEVVTKRRPECSPTCRRREVTQVQAQATSKRNLGMGNERWK